MIMADIVNQKQIEDNLSRMDKRLLEVEERMSSIDSKLTQVVDAILGNALTKTGGFIEEINILKIKMKVLEEQAEKQEEFKKKILWTIGIVVTVAIILEYLTQLYSNIKGG
jgi:UDP-N-acetylglucosamine 2-epimerase